MSRVPTFYVLSKNKERKCTLQLKKIYILQGLVFAMTYVKGNEEETNDYGNYGMTVTLLNLIYNTWRSMYRPPKLMTGIFKKVIQEGADKFGCIQ